MKRLLTAALSAAVLTGVFAPQAARSSEPPPDEGSDWSGWLALAATNESPMVEDQSIMPLGDPGTNNTSSTLADALAAPPPDPEPEQIPIDLGLGEAPAPNNLISETVRALDYNWAQCYLFVRNQVRFAPCKGFLRGPERTLLDREGSDGEQAFLLFAMLQACPGYTNSAKVLYAEPPVSATNGGFTLPLGGTVSGYDAVSWLGVSATGTPASVWSTVYSTLNSAGLGNSFCAGSATGSLSSATVRLPHFWVQLTLNGTNLDLDPSFKPRNLTLPRGSLLADMLYTRSNLLAQAGGTTNADYVQGLSFTNLAAELRRLSANLAANWQSVGGNVAASYFVGGDTVVPQNLSVDSQTSHGTASGTVVDFLKQTNSYKNALRTSLTLKHGTLTNMFWLDEIGARHLWLSYTTSSQAYPKVVLHLDDSVVTNEPSGSTQMTVTAVMTVSNSLTVMSAQYVLLRSNVCVYAIPVGFGGDHRGGMRDRAENDLGRLLAAGLSNSDVSLRSRVLQVAGQQWLAQTALLGAFDSRFKGSGLHVFYNVGISAQSASPYVDFKNCFFRTIADQSKLDGYWLFVSALEHGTLDQLNGTNWPAVSTVRVIDLANSVNVPVYFVGSQNSWLSRVRSALTNYDAQTIANVNLSLSHGHKVLLPKDGRVTLNHWSGYGYIDYGGNTIYGYTTGLLISGGLNGGYTSDTGSTSPSYTWNVNANCVFDVANLFTPVSLDPLDMLTGASLVDRTDLALAAPMPLAWTRHYDSRQHWNDGPLGRGWSHPYDGKITVHADPDAFFGFSTPAACVPAAVASAVVADLLAAGENAKNLTTACLVAKWWVDQLVQGAATARTFGQALSFTRSPDGSFAPAAGVTATLAFGANGQYTVQQRLGPTLTFATNGMLAQVQDPSGNFTALSYTNGTCLVAVSNSFGRKFTVGWDGSRISSVSDSAGRNVTYRYSPTGCLTGVTDVAKYAWSMAYDTNGLFLSETDPTGVATVRNAYNSLDQVTNQVSANGRTWVFGFAAGVGSWDRDPLTNRIGYTFSDDGRLSQRVGRDSTTNWFFYDGQGQVVSNRDAIGRVTLCQYDGSNCLVRLTEAANTANARATAFLYDGQHRLVAVSNALGRMTRMTYDTCHRLTSRVMPDGTVATNVYDSHGLPTSSRVLDSAGRELTLATLGYDSRGFATTVASTDAGTVHIGYDNAGNVTCVTDSLSHATSFVVDPRGFVTNTVDALNGRTVRTFTPAGRLSTVSDPLVHTRTFLWSTSGRAAGVLLPNSSQTTNEFDAADRLVAAKDARGNRVALDLDAMGRVTRRFTPNWQNQAWYDRVGSATTRVDAVSGRTDIGYDWLDRPVVVTDPLRYAWTNFFDPLDGLTSVIDPKHRPTSYDLDSMERRTRISYPSGRTEFFGADGLGRMTVFTNSEGHVYRLAYDGQNRLLAATNGVNEQVFRNTFDTCGNLTNRFDGAGRATRRQFDALNRCTNTVYGDGSSEAFTFNAVGDLLAAKNAATTNTFAYDSMDRLVAATARVAGVTFVTTYRRDLGGFVTNLTFNGTNSIRYGSDADGRLTNVTDWAGHTWRFTRDAAGRVTGLSYPNASISGTFGYDASHAVSNWSYSGAAGLPGRSITRDSMGLKTREDVTGGPTPAPLTERRAANHFDAADRLTYADVTIGSNTFTETYFHDPCGALTNIVRSPGTNDVYTHDLAGRMTSATASNLSLVASYDAGGNRVKTTINGTTRLWAIDHADPLKRPLMETTTNGTPVRYYIWGTGRLLAVIDADGTTRYAHCDDQGSVVALTSTNGAVLFTANYGPYGEPWGTTGTNATPFGWLGGHGVFHADGSSLYLTRYRAYDTTLKRFLSLDPMGLGGGANLYAYASGNPLSYIDPFGLCGESVAGAAWNGFVQNLAEDGWNNMNQGAAAILNSPYNAIAGAAAYAGRLSEDFPGTLNGTFNNPANAIQNYSRNSVEDYMSNPAAVSLSVMGGGTMALGFTPAGAAGDTAVVPASAGPIVEDTVSLFHQGILRGGEVSSTRALSTSLSSDLTHYNPAGTLYEFQLPRSVYNQWYRDLLIEPRTDLHLGTGIVTPELRIMPPASGQLNQYLLR